jgi:hypothetical protein
VAKPEQNTSPEYDPIQALGGGLEFLKNSNRRLARSVYILAIAVIVIAILAGIGFMRHQKTRYYAVTPDLRVVKMTPLSQPALSKSGLRQWAVKAVTETFALDFVRWRKELNKASDYYTPKAFKSLLASMKQAGLIDMIKKQRLDSAVSVTDAAVVTNTSKRNGVLYVRLNVPIVISYENSKGTVGRQKLMADVVVRRVPVTTYPSGVAIAQIVMRQDSGDR